MTFDPGLAERLREAFAAADVQDISERAMFGGLVFMVGGHMACGIVADDLMVRVGPDQYAEALARPHARAMDFTGRPLRGFVFVAPPGFEADTDLMHWLETSLCFVASLPPRAGKADS
ncbi:TfoX/Sxy family protein [Salinisphaera aquimarina]|uniref:TfoX/Sxy family protein n=1 Tax=Salinisphaera aquimarina TaxID=2094031 RepID=A0ABV7EMV6_9GAMM